MGKSDPETSRTDRQTDGQTDRRHAIAIPRFALKCIALGRQLMTCYDINKNSKEKKRRRRK